MNAKWRSSTTVSTGSGRSSTGDIGPLTELVGSIQKRACRAALSILGEVEREEARLEQMIEAIGEAFDSRDRELRAETAQAKETANHLQEIAIAKFEDVCEGLRSRIGREAADRRFFVTDGVDDLFHVNDKEDFDEAERRFAPWLEPALVKGLDQWRRGE